MTDRQHFEMHDFTNQSRTRTISCYCISRIVSTIFVEFSKIGFQFSQPLDVKVTALAGETEKDAIKEISLSSIFNFATSFLLRSQNQQNLDFQRRQNKSQ